MGVVHGATAAPAVDLSSVDAVLELIRQNGGRATTSRRTLLEILFEGGGHHSAEELAIAVKARAPDVHLSTVYRNLDELERLGVVVHAHLGHGPVTYQLARQAHAHFVCEGCGRRVDVPERLFRGLAQSARKSFGFEIDPRHQAIMGWCAACSPDRD